MQTKRKCEINFKNVLSLVFGTERNLGNVNSKSNALMGLDASAVKSTKCPFRTQKFA